MTLRALRFFKCGQSVTKRDDGGLPLNFKMTAPLTKEMIGVCVDKDMLRLLSSKTSDKASASLLKVFRRNLGVWRWDQSHARMECCRLSLNSTSTKNISSFTNSVRNSVRIDSKVDTLNFYTSPTNMPQ